MKIIAFLGEKYFHYNNEYFANPTSAAFLQKMLGDENIYVISPSIDVSEKPITFSSKVREDKFTTSPYYTSTKDFILKCLFTKNYYRNFKFFSDNIINSNPDAVFWIRTPSVGSIFFGLRAIKYNRKIINHMCADIKNTWRDKKYSFLEKCFGFITSHILRFLLGKICSNKNTINLATGSSLEKFGLNYSSRTYQFVDLMSEIPNININVKPNIGKKNNEINLTFVGRLVRDKGIFDLLDIMKRLPYNVTLNVVGGGESYQDVLQFIKDHSLANRVSMHGQLPFSELTKIYKKTDLTIVPSNNYYEGFPRVIMESWSHGIPIIVSNVGGVSAFVKNDINGLIFQPGDKHSLEKLINNIINDEKIYIKIKEGAIKMADISTFEYWSNEVRIIIKENF